VYFIPYFIPHFFQGTITNSVLTPHSMLCVRSVSEIAIMFQNKQFDLFVCRVTY